MDAKTVCFITCVNDEKMYQECLLYLRHLKLPKGMSGECIAIRGATSMTEGYNCAMQQSDAKYKIYIHQDFLLQNKNAVKTLLDFFKMDASIGMIGLAGCEKLPQSFCWGEAVQKYGSIAHALETECTTISVYGAAPGGYAEVEAIDGILIATQYDLPWRQDLLRGWHFYDISESLEFKRQGYKVVVPDQSEPWGIHLCGIKELGEDYGHWLRICQQEYKATGP